MPFDASGLWWPPLQRLADSLLSPAIDEDIEGILKEYEEVLKSATGFFKGPSAESKRVLETEPSLSIGTKKLPISASLRKPVLEVSGLLGLDELQTLILLRRWQTAGAEAIVGEELSHQQRTSITQYYVRERAFLLTCLDHLLQNESGEEGEDSLATFSSKLVQGGLEGAVISALRAALSEQQPPLSNSSGDQQLVLAHPEPLAWQNSGVKRRIAALEMGPLLDVATLLYSQGRCSCSLERGLELLSGLRPFITAGADPQAAGPCWLDFQAFLLLLAVLDLGKLVAVVADERTLDAQAHRLGTKNARDRVDAELSSWGPPKPSAGGQQTLHGPLLLTWATFLCLSNVASQPAEEVAWQEHADLAWRSGALHTLSQALQSPGPASLTHLQAAALQQLLAAFLGSFRVSPSGLPAPVLDSLLSLLAATHQGDEELCEAVWRGEPALAPLRKFLEEARDLFPAFPAPFLRLLAALAWGPTAAAAAANYVICMPHMTSRHEQGDPAVRELPGEEKAVVAVQNIDVCGLTVSKGLEGRLLAVPAGAAGSEAVAKSLLICWHGALAAHRGGFLLLLAFLRSNLDSLRTAVEDPRRGRAAVEEGPAANLGLAAGLLARLPALYIPGALFEVRGVTLPEALAASLDLLSRSPKLPLESMGSCLEVFKGLTVSLAAKVAVVLSQTQLYHTHAAPYGAGHEDNPIAAFPQSQLLVLREFSNRVEAPRGSYPVTLGTLQITARMLAAGVSHPFLQAAVGYTLSHVMARLLHGRFAAAGERWRVIAAALQTLTAALRYEPASEGAPDISGWLRRTLGQRGAAAAYLFGALPPLMHPDNINGPECVGLEVALTGWFEFVPALLTHPDASRAAVLAEAFFQAEGGRASSAAAVLAACLGHPALPPERQGEAINLLAALGNASAPLSHVCFTACLPHLEGGEGIDPAFRQKLLAGFMHPHSVPETTFTASCALLNTAIKHHPSLQGVLLYPTGLRDPNSASSGAPGNDSSKGKGSAKATAKEASALDGLLEILKASAGPQASSAFRLAQTLQVLLALWQGGPTCYGAVQLLKSQPGFWKAVAAAVPQALQQRLQLGDGDVLQAWRERSEDAWKLSAEASALQLLALEAFRHPKAKSGDGEGSEVWNVLDGWATESEGGRLPQLLRRYGGPLQGAALMTQLQTTANAAALELLAALAAGNGVEDHIALPGSFLGKLWLAGASIIAASGEGGRASQELRAAARGLLNGTPAPNQTKAAGLVTKQELGAVLLRAAEATEQVQSESGPILRSQQLLYDSNKLAARVGRASFSSQPSLRALADLMSAVGVMSGFETARLAALKALAAVSGVIPPAEGAAATNAHMEALEAATTALLRDALVVPHAAFSPRQTGLAIVEQLVKVNLTFLHRSVKGKWVDARQAVSFSRRSLCLARKWLHASAADPALSSQEEITTGLLALGLKALRGSPDRSAASEKEGAELQRELRQTLPWLCKLVGSGGRRAAVSLALMTTMLTHHLPTPAWLPVLRAGLDLPGLVTGAYDRLAAAYSDESERGEARQTAAEVALGALHLILVAAQEGNGGSWLASSALLDALHAVAQWILFQDTRGPAEERQWLALLSLQALLVRGAPGGLGFMDLAAVRFATTSHVALLDALQPPAAAEEGVPLRLPAMQEAERSACFLAGMPRLLGEWLTALPPAAEQVKRAASDWVIFAAAPSLDPDLRITCPPGSSEEQALASQRAGISAVEGWFGLCSVGSEGQRRTADPDLLSEYAAKLAEAIYAAACHALTYLAALAPEGGLQEAHAVELGWPSAEVVLGLQGQCIALSHDLCQQPPNDGRGRAMKLCLTLANLLLASSHLQDTLRYPQPRGHASQVAETLERLERAKGRGS